MGDSDIPLDRTGIEQVKKLGKKLHEIPVHRVYCSDLRRAVQSAGLLFAGKTLRIMPELREMSFGIFEGLRYSQIMKKYPEIAKGFMENPFETVIPRGEHPRDFRRRVLRAFKKIVSRDKNKTSVIVTHGGPIRIILNDIERPKNIWDIIVPPASAHIIEITGPSQYAISACLPAGAVRDMNSSEKGSLRCLK
jgi:broad specificity phosphatase PhoE